MEDVFKYLHKIRITINEDRIYCKSINNILDKLEILLLDLNFYDTYKEIIKLNMLLKCGEAFSISDLMLMLMELQSHMYDYFIAVNCKKCAKERHEYFNIDIKLCDYHATVIVCSVLQGLIKAAEAIYYRNRLPAELQSIVNKY